LRHAVALGRIDDGRRIQGDVGLRRLLSRLRGPGLKIALRGLRQLAVRRRLDFEAAVAGRMPGARIIMPDIRRVVDVTAAVNGWLKIVAFAETERAFDDGVGHVDAVNNDGNAGTPGNHKIEALAGP